MNEVPSVTQDRKQPVKIDSACMPTPELVKALKREQADGKTILTVRYRLQPADEIELVAKGYRCKAGVAALGIENTMIYPVATCWWIF